MGIRIEFGPVVGPLKYYLYIARSYGHPHRVQPCRGPLQLVDAAALCLLASQLSLSAAAANSRDGGRDTSTDRGRSRSEPTESPLLLQRAVCTRSRHVIRAV